MYYRRINGISTYCDMLIPLVNVFPLCTYLQFGCFGCRVNGFSDTPIICIDVFMEKAQQGKTNLKDRIVLSNNPEDSSPCAVLFASYSLSAASRNDVVLPNLYFVFSAGKHISAGFYSRSRGCLDLCNVMSTHDE